MTQPLAIDGGAPVRSTLLPYARHWVDEADINAATSVLRGDWLTTGPEVNAFEEAVAARVGAKHAVALNSGTAALHAAAFVAGIKPGDDVIVPALTFAATANAVLYCGGRPVFADIVEDTGHIEPGALERLVTPQTRAIIPVDYAGQPADLDAVNAFADSHGLVVIEDAAHALGATYCGKPVGAWASLTTFSTHPVKTIATGEGGLVATDNAEYAERLRAFRNHGIAADLHCRAERGDWFYEMDFLGYNYRIPDVLCALGRSQLNKLDGFLARRRAIAAQYDAAFAGLPCMEPLVQFNDRESACHLYVVRLNLDRLRCDRKTMFRALRAEGIGVNVHYIPVYWHPHYQRLGYPKGLCPKTEAFYERILTLPLWPGMSEQDTCDVIEAVYKVSEAYAR